MMFPHSVPPTEPPIGTVAEFNSSFTGGAGTSSGLMIREEKGWSTTIRGSNPLSWAQMTDLSVMNAEIQRCNPGSNAVYGAVEVVIVSSPGQAKAVRDVPDANDLIIFAGHLCAPAGGCTCAAAGLDSGYGSAHEMYCGLEPIADIGPALDRAGFTELLPAHLRLSLGKYIPATESTLEKPLSPFRSNSAAEANSA